jgi:hypothetical protein
LPLLWEVKPHLIGAYANSTKKYGHYALTGRGGLYERWSWITDTISFIVKPPTFGTYYSSSRVMYFDEEEDEPSFSVWPRIAAAADSYAYAEQWTTPFPKNLTNWPNSIYQLGWPIPENNSNTFARVMADIIGRDPDDYLTGLQTAPGNLVPKPIVGTVYNQYQSILGPSPNNPFHPPTVNPANPVLWPPFGYTLAP